MYMYLGRHQYSGCGLRVDATATVTGIMADTFHGASVWGMIDVLNTLRWGLSGI